MRLFSIKLPIYHKLRDREKSERFLTYLKNSGLPFALEVGVNNIGKEINFQIAIPGGADKMLEGFLCGVWPEARMEKVHNYSIFRTIGFHEAVYFTLDSSAKWNAHDFNNHFLTALNNFSKINLLGEGIAFQIMCRPSGKGSYLYANIRAATSALSEDGAKELLNNFIESFPGIKAEDASNREFFKQFVNHEFNGNQTVKLTVGQLTQIFYF